MIIARLLPATPLAALLLAGAAHAETRASATVTAEAGYGSNPYFGSAEDQQTVSGVVRAAPNIVFAGPTSSLSVGGRIEHAVFASHFNDLTNWSLNSGAEVKFGPRSRMTASAGYASNVSSGVSSLVSPLPVPDGTILLPDPSAAELAGVRSKTLSGTVGFETSISAGTSLNLGANVNKVDYPSAFGASYVEYGGSASVSHAFSARFSGGLGVDFSKSEYDSVLAGNYSSYSPYAHASVKLAARTTLNVNLGASFTKVDGLNAAPTRGYFSGSGSLCHEGSRSNLCLTASRSVRSAAQTGTSTQTSFGGNYSYKLSSRSSLRLDAAYSDSRSIAFVTPLRSAYINTSAGYDRQITQRLSFVANARYTNPFKSIGGRGKSFYGGVGVTYRFGR